jgi:GxxExxY protein
MLIEEYNKISGVILDAAIDVHREMGPGLLESVYEYCLCKELQKRGLKIDQQAEIPLFYKGELLNKNFRIDILVEKNIVIELKAVECILPVHEAQIISYLKLSKKQLGIIINFNVPLLKQGYKRFVNKLID